MIRSRLARLGLLLAALLIAPRLWAETSLTPLHQGYAFDNQRVLVHQRLFGLAHAVTLLAATCIQNGAGTTGREALLEAYGAWNDRQAQTIEESRSDLARYYFGARAAEANWTDIVRALKLKEKLDLKPGSLELFASCDSLPEALQKPRYDLHRQYRLQLLAARLAAATKTEAKAEACATGLSDANRLELDNAMSHWREAYGPQIDDAKAILEQHWSDAQLDGTLDDWLNQAKEQGKRAAKKSSDKGMATEKARSCATMPAWLLTQQADPDDDFNPHP